MNMMAAQDSRAGVGVGVEEAAIGMLTGIAFGGGPAGTTSVRRRSRSGHLHRAEPVPSRMEPAALFVTQKWVRNR